MRNFFTLNLKFPVQYAVRMSTAKISLEIIYYSMEIRIFKGISPCIFFPL